MLNRHRLLRLAIGLMAVAAIQASALAESVKSIGCNNMDINSILSTENMTLVSWSVHGIIRDQSDRAEPDISQHCVGTTLTHAGQRIARGYCTFMYPDGDRAVIEVTRNGEGPGSWRFVDGTGKYAGVTGEGTYSFITQARPVQEGTWQYCTENEGSYTLKE
jgi:hypothetical protein